MNRIIFAVALIAASNAVAAPASPPPGFCTVKVCNKIERWSLSPWSHIKDKVGETCSNTILPKDEAVKGKELSSESRWYQGETLNPTKKSVTRVKEVYECK